MIITTDYEGYKNLFNLQKIANKADRTVLTGVHIKADTGITATATESHALTTAYIFGKVITSGEVTCKIPKIPKFTGTMTIESNTEFVTFSVDDLTMRSVVFNERFPDIQRLRPETEGDGFIKLNPKLLKLLLDQYSDSDFIDMRVYTDKCVMTVSGTSALNELKESIIVGARTRE